MRIRSFVLLGCLLFSSEVKAVDLSLKSNMTRICVQRQFFLEKEAYTCIPLPFVLEINFRTPYIFDLVFQQQIDIAFGREQDMQKLGKNKIGKPFFWVSGNKYECKNEYTSFIYHPMLKVSKRKMIKKIYERVVFCFNFDFPFLFFNLLLLTKEAGNFNFFHFPECEKGEEKKHRPFGFNSFFWFFTAKKGYYSSYFDIFCGPKGKMIISNLCPFAYFFSFSFDILVCSYLSCCIKIPFDIVFFFFFLPFTYLSLNKECKKKENIIENKDDGTFQKSGKGKLQLAISTILSLFNFSIGIFDKEEIEE